VSLDNKIKIWDAATREETLSFPAGYPVAISPDGGRLAVTGPGDVVKILDKKGRELLLCRGHSADIHSLAFSPDGTRLASVGKKNAIKVWECTTGQLLLAMEQGPIVTAAAWSPNGKDLAVGDYTGQIKIWNARTGQDLYSFDKVFPITSLALNHDGSRLVSGHHQAAIKIWDMTNRKVLHTLLNRGGRVEGVAFSPGGALVASVDEKQLILWNTATGKKIREWPFPGRIRAVAFAPDGRHLLTGNHNSTIHVFRLPADLGKD
jgi:WD40 repeat protein